MTQLNRILLSYLFSSMVDSIAIYEASLVNDNDLLFVRQLTKLLCDAVQIIGHEQTRVITAVSEVTRNALQYGGRSRVAFRIDRLESATFLTAAVSDRGPGISNIDAVLDDNYVSTTGLGKGLSGARRLVDRFDIKSSSEGTTVSLSQQVRIRIDERDVARWKRAIGESTPGHAIDQLKQQNTQLSLMLQELESTKQQLERANNLKGEFLANVSHEIRTPMNAIIGIANILDRTQLDEEQHRLLALLRDSSKSLLTIINDVLDLSKIEAGKMQLNIQTFDLLRLLDMTVSMLTPQAHEKGLRLVLDQGDIPQFVSGDADRIRQILINLIGNAIKFSDKGEITIFATTTDSYEESARVKFSVTDHGLGIPVEKQHLLFQPFVQVPGSSQQKHTGTGLGLSICKRLIELMGGQIGMESVENKGSTFWFELPLSVEKSTELAVSAPVPASAIAEGKLVLVAEDHRINQMVILTELEMLGLKVDIVEDGEKAVSAALSKQYDAVLMDCQMPVLDGFEACKQIREKEQTTGRHVPIIAMTANAMSGAKEQCLAAGMDDYIAKPFEPEDLKRVLAQFLGTIATDDVQEPVIDRDRLATRYGENRSRILIEAFLEDTDERLPKLREMFDNEEWNRLAREAHALKGACGVIFASGLQSVCEQLEHAAKDNNRKLCAQLLDRFADFYRRVSESTTSAV